MDESQRPGPEPLRFKGRRFRVGIALLATSFGVFGLYVVVPFLPLSVERKVFIVLVGSLISWCVFLIGTLLAGPDGYLYLKRLVRRCMKG